MTLKKRPAGSLVSTFEQTRVNRSDSRSAPLLTPLALLLLGAVQMARAQTERSQADQAAGQNEAASQSAAAAAEQLQLNWDEPAVQAEAAPALPAELLALLQAVADAARQSAAAAVGEGASIDAAQTAQAQEPTSVATEDRLGQMDRAEAVLEAYQNVIDQLPADLVLAQAPAAGAEAAAAGGISTGAMLAGLLGLVALGAGGGGSGGPAATPVAAATTDITLHDGYIDGADVYVDLNDNGRVDVGVDKFLGQTKNGGKLAAVLTDADKLHGLIAQGGKDISTDSDFIGSFSTTAGSTVINPLSTLVQTLVQSTIGTLSGLSAADREAALKDAKASAISTVSTALGIDSDVDLTQIDTVKASSGTTEITVGFDSADAIELHSKALMVANMISVGAATLAGAAGDANATANLSKFVVQGIVNSISSAASSGEAVSFKSVDSVTQILNTAVDAAKQSGQSLDDTVVTNATANVAGAVAATNQLINAFAGEAAKAVAAATPGNAAAAATSGLTQMLQAQKVVNNQIDGLKSADSATLTQLNALGDVTQVQAQARQVTSGLKVGTTTVEAIIEPPSNINGAPTIERVDVRPARVGDLAQVVVKMSEPVLVKVGENGRPTLTVTTSAADAQSPTTAIAQYEPGLSSGDNLVFTYRVQPSDVRVAVATGSSITLPANTTIRDLAAADANTSVPEGASVSVDSIAPTVAISSNLAFVKAGATATVTFTVSEAVSTRAANAFTAEDVTVKNGALTEFKKSTDNPNVYTAKIAATSATAPAEIGVAGGKFTDAAGNGNLPSNVVLLAQEGAAPVVAISADRNFFNTTNTTQGSTPSTALKFSLSAASTDFTAEDVVITGGGELSNFQGSGKDYTATITGMTSATKVSVAKDSFGVTGATAKNIASNELGFKVDVVKPTVTLSLLKGATGTDAVTETTVLKAGESAGVSFTVSEDVVGFGPQSIKVVGGFLEGFAPDKSGPNKFSAVFRPAAPEPGQTGAVDASITVMDGRFADTAGNTNTGTSARFFIDNTRPLVTEVRSDNTQGAAKAGASVVYTYTFNKPVSDLAAADFVAERGSVTDVRLDTTSLVSGTHWKVTVTPQAGVAAGKISLTLKPGSVADVSGNTNLEHKQAIQAIDTVAPTAELELSRSTFLKASANGGQAVTGDLTIKFSEPVQSIAQNAFTVTGAGGTVGTPAKVGTDGRVWKATFTPAAADLAGEVQVKMTAGSYTDAAGNPGGPADSAAVRTNVVAPVLTITADKAVMRTTDTSTTVTFAFSEAVKDFDRSDVAVEGGTLGALTNVDAKTWTAVFTPTASSTPTTARITVADDKFVSTADNIKGIGDDLDLKTNQTNPSLAIAMTDAKADGTLVFSVEASDPAVTGLSSSGFTATNGTVGTLQPDSVKGKFALTVTPLASGDVVVSAKEGAGSTDLPTLASSSAPAKVILGTSSGETLDLTTTREVVVTGGGNDIIRITDVAQSPATAADLIAGVAKGDKLDISALINKTGTTQQYFALVDTSYPLAAPTGWLKVIEDTDALRTPGDNELHFKEEVRSDGSIRLSFVYDTNSDAGTTVVSQPVGISFLPADQAALTEFLGASPGDYVIADKVAPRVTVSMQDGKAALAKDGPGTATVVFTTNEFVSALPKTSITVLGGNITDPVQSKDNPLVWTSVFTTADQNVKEGSISVAAASFSDMEGNLGTASNVQSLVLNAVAPVLRLDWSDVKADGKVVFKLVSDQALTGLTDSDFEGTGYTVNSVTAVANSGNKTFEVAITPTASGNISVRMPADAATGAVLGTPAITAAPNPLEIIKAAAAGGEIVVNGLAERVVVLGAGADVVKVGAFTAPVSPGPVNLGVVAGVAAGDSFDLSGLFKTTFGYSSAVEADLPDTGAGFVELENLVLTKKTSTTEVTFDITFDSATYNNSRVEGFKIDLEYNYAQVTGATSGVTSITIAPDETAATWNPIQPNLRTTTSGGVATVANGQIAGILDQNYADEARLIDTTGYTDGSGKVMSVKLVIGSLIDSFKVGLESKDSGGDTYINVAGSSEKFYPEVGVAKTARAAGVPAGAIANVLEYSGSTTTVPANTAENDLPNLASQPGDNQLKFLQIVETGSEWGMLKFQFDTNPAVGTTTLSPVIEVDLVSTDLTALFNSDYVKLI